MNNSDAQEFLKTIKNKKSNIYFATYQYEALDKAIDALQKLSEIKECIDACENCITYQGCKEFTESEAYETIKGIINEQ